MNAPWPITETVATVCSKYNVSIKTFDADTNPTLNKLLMIGSSYVIALDFYVEEVK
jgi:hypothetical protein